MSLKIGQINSKTINSLLNKTFDWQKEILSQVFEEGTILSDIAIQAPPGTQIAINNENTIITIGRSGLYEMPEPINVSKLWVEKTIEDPGDDSIIIDYIEID